MPARDFTNAQHAAAMKRGFRAVDRAIADRDEIKAKSSKRSPLREEMVADAVARLNEASHLLRIFSGRLGQGVRMPKLSDYSREEHFALTAALDKQRRAIKRLLR